jgi:hypothetical protein
MRIASFLDSQSLLCASGTNRTIRQMLGDEKLWRARLRADWNVWDACELVRRTGGSAKSVYVELMRIRRARYVCMSPEYSSLCFDKIIFVVRHIFLPRADTASHLESACIDGSDRTLASIPRQSNH